MVRRNAGPSQSALIDFLGDPDRMAHRLGVTPGQFFNSYAAAALERDPGLAAQLREQLAAAPLGVQAAMRSPGSAWAALNVASAPGAKLDGRQRGLGHAAAALHSGSGIRNAFGETEPSDGGFLLAEQVRSDLMVSVLDTAIVRPGATVLPMAQGGLTLPYVDDSDHSSAVLGGISFSWYAEGEAITASSPLFGRLRFEPWKAAALLDAIPNELLSDGADAMGAFLRLVIPGAYAQAEDSKFLWGTGTAEPEGATECSCVISVTRDTSSHITAVDIAAMLARMLPYSLGRAVWVASNDTLPDLLALSTAIGTPADTATGTTGWLTWGPDGPRLLGKPVYFTERAPKLGTAGDLTLIDRQFYAIGDRLEMRLDHSGLGDGFPHDESQYRVTARVDGHCWCRTPLTPANGGSTVSPVVVLS